MRCPYCWKCLSRSNALIYRRTGLAHRPQVAGTKVHYIHDLSKISTAFARITFSRGDHHEPTHQALPSQENSKRKEKTRRDGKTRGEKHRHGKLNNAKPILKYRVGSVSDSSLLLYFTLFSPVPFYDLHNSKENGTETAQKKNPTRKSFYSFQLQLPCLSILY